MVEKCLKSASLRIQSAHNVCVCVGVGVCVCESCYHMQAQTHIHTYFNPWSESRAGVFSNLATAPFISPWPTKLLMFGEDMQSDQLHVPANRTVDFCSSMTLFALRKNFTFRTVSSITCTSFWFSELVREPSCIALTWHRACSGAFMYCAGMALSSFGNLHVLRWHGTELIGDLSCCIGVALSYSLEIFI